MENKEQTWERKNRVYDLRIRGKSYRQIASAESISVGTAHRWVQEVLDATVLPNVEAIRKTEIDRLMRYLDMLDERVSDGDDKAISLALKISERLCKMLGADMPTQVQVEKTEVTQVDLALQDLISRQQAQNALRRQEAEQRRQEVEPADAVSDRLSEAIEDIIAEN